MNIPLTIESARGLLKTKKISAQEFVEHTLDLIDALQKLRQLNAYTQTFRDEAMAQAKNIDESGEIQSKPLAGIPIAVKDNICTTEGKTTAASRILGDFSALYDATVITRLKNAGAIIIGKTNLDEFAMGSSTEYSAFGATKNPWDKNRVPGGSSGGSGVAVTADGSATGARVGGVLAALGTDTGGSIRLPASFCNVVGVKPTYGRVSRFGAIAYGSSLDQIGPFARTVKDAALMLQVMAGQDPLDATTSPNTPAQYTNACIPDVKGLTIGVPKEFFAEGLDGEVETVVKTALKQLEGAGAILKTISLPLTSAGIPVYYLLAKAEASSNLARFDALRYGAMHLEKKKLVERYEEARSHFGSEVKRAILMGNYALSAGYYDAWYKQASKVRTLIRREYIEAFKEVDVIAGPVAPEAAFEFGSKTDNPLAMYLADALTVPISVAGIPAMSVPAGFTKNKLPVGLQIAAPHFQEERMFQVAYAYEQLNPWWQETPAVSNKE